MSLKENLAEDFRTAVRTKEVDRLLEHWGELLDKKDGDSSRLRPQDFSVREMFKAAVEDGTAILEQWFYNPADRINLRESGVNTANFSRINRQLMSDQVMRGYEAAAFIGEQLVDTRPSPTMYGERIGGIAEIGDQAEAVGEAKPFPLVGTSEDFVQVPDKIKRGMICPVTKEAIMQDRTGDILKRCSNVGYWMGENKEQRILNTVVGNVSTYNRKGRGVVPNYGDNAGAHDFDNLAASNALVDWTDIEAAGLLFDAMVDPNTGTSIAIDGRTVLVPSGLAFTAGRIINATEVEHVDNQANAATIRTRSANPVTGFSALSTSRLSTIQGNQTTWYRGDFKRAFAYLEAWPITVTQAPPNSEEEFNRDIVDRYKVSECGVCVAEDPRYVVKCTQ